MKRAMLIVAVAVLCVAGSAVAQERGGLIGSGTRTEDSGQVIGSGNAPGQTVGSGGRSEDGSQTSGLAVFEIRSFDGWSLLMVMLAIPIEE